MHRTLVLDDVTPLAAYARLRTAFGQSPSFLLESAPIGGERWGRFSLIGVSPRRRVTLDMLGPPRAGSAGTGSASDVGKVRLQVHDLRSRTLVTSRVAPAREAIHLLRAHAGPSNEAHPETAPRVVGSAVGYLAYDLVHALEPVAPWPGERRLAHLLVGATFIVFDALLQTVSLYGDDAALLGEVEGVLRGPSARLRPLRAPKRTDRPRTIDTSLDDATFEARVAAAKEYIAAGDVFQVVLARAFSTPRRGADPFDAYRAIRILNGSPYLYFLDLQGSNGGGDGLDPIAIAGASPETLVRLEDGVVTLRPLAGTRPRGADDAADRALEAELRADPKEVAEHVMLVDLGRNDVGRVSATGSVSVPTRLAVERYSHVMHLVSEVRGKLQGGKDAWDVLEAAFPAGTLSGAPKVRAMQIIRELEAGPRGVYGGAIGYVSSHGTMDLAIAIRTLVAYPDRFEISAGAGVVEGSVPAMEAAETRQKAGAALAAAASALDEGD